MDEENGFNSFEVLTEQVTTSTHHPTDVLYIDIAVKWNSTLKKKAIVVYLIPLQTETIESLIIPNEEADFINTVVSNGEYKPTSIFTELPLPNEKSEVDILDYTEEERHIAIHEIATYIVKEGSQRFIQPHHNIKILAGDDEVDDIQLVLLAKTLSQVSAEVWYDSTSTGLFPGIPEKEVTIQVPLRNESPIKHKVRRLNDKYYFRAQQQLNKKKERGLIEDVILEFGFPITCVDKKNDKLRVCGDYETLNERAVRDVYPFPLPEQLIAALRGAKFLSLFDLSSGFQQLYLYKLHRERLTIVTPFGQYQPIRLPYSFINGPSAFQRQYDLTMGSMIQWGRAYIDDLALNDSKN